MQNKAISDALERIEVKRRGHGGGSNTRRVRTPEGSRMYGQPIGTVITRDMIERAKRKREQERAKENGSSSRSADTRMFDSSSAGSSAPKKPIPSDYSEPGLPGMSKFKSKAEANKKRHEKLLAKMGQGSTVVDENGQRDFIKVSGSAFDSTSLYWETMDGDDDKEYSDAEVAEILKGANDFSYKHYDEDGEIVKDHTAERPDIMGGVATGNFGQGKKPEDDAKKPSTAKPASSPEAEIAFLEDGLAKLKAKRNEGTDATKKRRERQIAKAEERLAELKKNRGDSKNQTPSRKEILASYELDKRTNVGSVKVGDAVHSPYAGDGMSAIVKVSKIENLGKQGTNNFDTYSVTYDNGDVLEYPDTDKIDVMRLKDSSKTGSSKSTSSAPKKTSANNGSDNGTSNEPEFHESRAYLIKKGDVVRHDGKWKTVTNTEKNGNRVTLTFDDGSTRESSDEQGFDVQYPNGKKPKKGENKKPPRAPGTSLFGNKPSTTSAPTENGGDEGSSSLTSFRNKRDESKEESPDGYVEGDEGSASNLKPGDKVFNTYYSGGKPSKVVLTVASTDRTKENGKYSYGIKFTNGTGSGGTIGTTRYTRAIPEDSSTSGTENSGSLAKPKSPKIAVPAPAKFAVGNDVHNEPRPLTGDEVSKRAVEYDDLVKNRVKEWREYSDEQKGYSWYRKSTPLDAIAKLEAYDGNKIPSSEADLKWSKSPVNGEIELAQWGGVTLVRDTKNGSMIYAFGTQTIALPYATDRDITAYDSKTEKLARKPEAFKILAKDRNIKRFLNETPPKRVKREDVPFWDYWNGIRGIDWMNDGETDADYDGVVSRRLKAKEESMRLGVNIGDGFNVGMHEAVNSVLETYRERYPGFLDNAIDSFAIDSKNAGALAWLGSARPMSGLTAHTKKPLIMGLGKAVFGDDDDSVNVTWKRESVSSELTGYKVGGDRTALAEKLGVAPEHISAMYTFNHEMGHAVGHWIMGQTSVSGGFATTQPFNNPKRAKEIKDRYDERITPIFHKYGVLSNKNKGIDDYIDVSNYSSTGDQKLLGKISMFNKTKLMANLSGYGAHNWHEIMAESWASYSMDENPTEFVLEMGEAMEDLLLEILDEAGYGDPEEKGLSLRETLQLKVLGIFA